MVKLEMDEVGLLAAIDALKRVSPEQQRLQFWSWRKNTPALVRE